MLDTFAKRADFELLFEGGAAASERLRIWRVSAAPLDDDR
jgi:hypothetical protein